MPWFDEFPTATVNGFVMLVDPLDENIGKRLQTEGVWEPLGTKTMEDNFKSGTFVDCGAHWGYYSLLASRKASKVYAFEGNPNNFRYLTLNLLINKTTNIDAYPLALWNEPAIMQADFSQGNTGGSGLGPHADSSKPQIQATTIDDFGFDSVSFIKVDCEGADSNILKGAVKTLERFMPDLLVESPPADFLKGLGYADGINVGGGHGPLTFFQKA